MSLLFHVIVDVINTNPKIGFAVSIDRYCTERIALSAKHVRVTDLSEPMSPNNQYLWKMALAMI